MRHFGENNRKYSMACSLKTNHLGGHMRLSLLDRFSYLTHQELWEKTLVSIANQTLDINYDVLWEKA